MILQSASNPPYCIVSPPLFLSFIYFFRLIGVHWHKQKHMIIKSSSIIKITIPGWGEFQSDYDSKTNLQITTFVVAVALLLYWTTDRCCHSTQGFNLLNDQYLLVKYFDISKLRHVPVAHDVITLLLRQQDVATWFWRNNDVMVGSCVRWDVFRVVWSVWN